MNGKTCFRWGAAALFATTLSTPALAAMGNTASTYGLMPMDVGSAQAFSLFNPQASALYYNPAYLTKDERGELSIGILHGEQELRAKSLGNPLGGEPAVMRSGDVLNDTRSQQTIIALKTDLTNITKFEQPIYFAVIAGLEKYGQEMLAFQSETSDEGQFFHYGRQPLFLNLGGGMEILNGVNVGGSVHVSLSAEAQMTASSNLAGETQHESLNVSAKPVLRPVLSASLDWAKILCGRRDCGIWSGLETAIAFRGRTEAKTSVDANITIPGTVVDPGISLLINTIDSYQPDIFSAGLQYTFSDRLRVAASVEQQNWSDLERKLDRDTIKDQARAEFKDIVVPRIGVEYGFTDSFSVVVGAAYQESPLKSIRTPDVNYFDSDKIIAGLGASYVIQNPPILSFPMQLDFGYQYHHLDSRKFELSTTRAGVESPYEIVDTDGEVHVFSGAITVKF